MARLLAILVAVLVASSGAPTADAQVWKPKMQPGARAKAKQATPKKTRKAKPKRGRSRVDKAPVVKKKHKKKKATRRRVHQEDDFVIIEEDFPDE
jgi:hypothetical protein